MVIVRFSLSLPPSLLLFLPLLLFASISLERCDCETSRGLYRFLPNVPHLSDPGTIGFWGHWASMPGRDASLSSCLSSSVLVLHQRPGSRRPGLSTSDGGLANKEPMFRRFVTGDISVDARMIARNRVVEAKLPGLRSCYWLREYTRAATELPVRGEPRDRETGSERAVSFLQVLKRSPRHRGELIFISLVYSFYVRRNVRRVRRAWQSWITEGKFFYSETRHSRGKIYRAR